MNEQYISSLKYANKTWLHEADVDTLTTLRGRTENPLSCFSFTSYDHKCLLLTLHVSIASSLKCQQTISGKQGAV